MWKTSIRWPTHSYNCACRAHVSSGIQSSSQRYLAFRGVHTKGGLKSYDLGFRQRGKIISRLITSANLTSQWSAARFALHLRYRGLMKRAFVTRQWPTRLLLSIPFMILVARWFTAIVADNRIAVVCACEHTNFIYIIIVDTRVVAGENRHAEAAAQMVQYLSMINLAIVAASRSRAVIDSVLRACSSPPGIVHTTGVVCNKSMRSPLAYFKRLQSERATSFCLFNLHNSNYFFSNWEMKCTYILWSKWEWERNEDG